MTEQTPVLDRDVLRDLTTESMTKGNLLIRDVPINTREREQLRAVIQQAEQRLKPHFEDPDWSAFQDLVEEGEGKGLLYSFTLDKNTNTPSWCVDGGPDAQVRKVRTGEEKRPGIEVPSHVHRLYGWKLRVDSLKELEATSSELLRGRMAKLLGEDLVAMAFLLKEDS